MKAKSRFIKKAIGTIVSASMIFSLLQFVNPNADVLAAPYSMSDATLKDATIVEGVYTYAYTSSRITPTVTVNGIDLARSSSGTTRNYSTNSNGQYYGTTVGDYSFTATGSGRNYNNAQVSGSKTFNWRIVRADIQPRVTMNGWTYNTNNTGNSPRVSGNTGSGSVTYTYYTDEACTDDVKTGADNGATTAGGRPSFAGTYWVKADIAQTTNYNAGTCKTSFTIQRANFTPRVTIADWTYGEDAKEPTVTNVPSGLEATCTYYTDSTCTTKTTSTNSGAATEGGVPVNAGTYYVQATVPQSTNYNAATSTATKFVIKQADSVASVGALNLFYTGVAQNLLLEDQTVVPDGSGEIRFSINDFINELDPGVQPKAKNVGTYTVYYRVEVANDNYVNQEFSEDRKVVVEIYDAPTVSMENYTYGQSAAVPAPSITAFDDDATFYCYNVDNPTDIIDMTGMTSVTLNVGTYKIYAELEETEDHVAFTTAESTFTVEVNKQTAPIITIADGSYEYNGGAFEPEVTVSDSEDLYVIPSSEYEVSYSTNTEPGTATVTITDKVGGNYNVSGTQTFDISKASFVPTVTMSDYTWGDKVSTPSITGNTSNGEVTYYYYAEGETVSTKWENIDVDTLNAGTYYIFAKVAETDLYQSTQSEPVSFKILKVAIDPSVTIESWEYGEEASEPEVTGNTDNGDVTFTYYMDSDCTVMTSTEDTSGATEEGGQPVNANLEGESYYVKATIAETTNYEGAEAICEFNITQKTPVKGTDYDVIPNPLTYTAVAQELVTVTENEDLGIRVVLSYDEGINELASIPSKTNADSYYIYYKVVGTQNYSDVDWVGPVEVTIKQADSFTMAPGGIDQEYNARSQNLVTGGILTPVKNGDDAGTILYAIGTDSNTAPTDGYSDTIPTAKDAGKYYVWYKVDGGNNYISYEPVCITSTISQRPVVVSNIGAKDKVYDKTTDAEIDISVINLSGRSWGDRNNLSATATVTFEDANVGEDKTVVISNIELTGTAKDNYVLAEEGQQETTTATISPLAVTVDGIKAEDKLYDGTTDVVLDCTDATVTGVIDGDEVTVVSAEGAFEDSEAGKGKTVNIDATTIVLGGSSVDNYILAEDGNQATTTANIGVAEVTVSGIEVVSKTYDGTTDADLDYSNVEIDGIDDGDDVSVEAIGTYEDKNVGEGKTVAISNIVLTGEDAGNYILAKEGQQDEATGDITAKTVTVSGITAEDKPYDGELTATLVTENAVFDGIIDGDKLEVTATGTYETAHIAIAKVVNITDIVLSGDDVDNYVLAEIGNQETTTSAITTAPLTITAKNQSVELNGEIEKSVDEITVEGLVGDHYVSSIVLESSETTAITEEGTITASKVFIKNGDGEDVTDHYDVTYVEGTLSVVPLAVVINTDPTASEIDFLDTLADSTLTGGKAQLDNTYETVEIAGTFAWADDTIAPEVSDSGKTEYEVIFTPDDTETYAVVSTYITVVVNPIDPEYEIPTGLTATYGDTLADVELPDGWAFADDETTSVGDVGNNTFTAIFTPEDDINYNTIEDIELTIAVVPDDPEFEIPTGLKATYGQTLADVTLPEGWAFADDETTSVGNAGTNTFEAIFTPEDTDNYNTVSGIEVTVEVAKIDPEYTVPTGLKATYGQTLANVKLPEGWAFADATASVGNAGTNTFKATFTPKDTANYNTISNVDVKVEVSKADATVKTAPTAIALTENGSAQALVNAGAANNGTMQYAIGTDAKTAPTSGYSTTIPTGTAVGTYYVWYKVVGAANYNDSKASCVTVTIAAKPVETGVAGFVERLYTVALGRESDPDGKKYWIDQVRTNGKTGADIAKGFLYSEEFLNSKASNEEFVETLYKTFFDRASEPEGKAFWVGKLADGSMSKMDVINGFINSTEWANLCLEYGIPSGGTGKANKSVEPNEDVIAFATRLYTTCLGRDPEAEGLKYWSTELANMRISGTDAAYGFFFSDEFVNKNLSNEDYVKSLYRTFMGREYDTEGFNYWVGRLNNGASRQEVFFGFAQSQEFGEICSSYGIIR